MSIEVDSARAAGGSAAHSSIIALAGDELRARLTDFGISSSVAATLGLPGGAFSELQSCDLRIDTDYSPDSMTAEQAKVQRNAQAECAAAAMDQLPAAADTFDLVIANLTPSFCSHENFFQEVFRILQPQGVFLFSIFGPRSFWQLFEAVQAISGLDFIAAFPDMHDVGDLLVTAGYQNPIIDTESSDVDFADFEWLINELCVLKLDCKLFDHAERLRSKPVQSALHQAYPRAASGCVKTRLTIEVVYGMCWKPALQTELADVLVPFTS